MPDKETLYNYNIMLKTDYRFGEVHRLADQIEFDASKVGFKNIYEAAGGGVVLISFKAGQKLEPHQAPAEVMVYLLEGEVLFTVGETAHTLHAGEFMLLGAGVTHSVEAKAATKLMLVKIKD